MLEGETPARAEPLLGGSSRRRAAAAREAELHAYVDEHMPADQVAVVEAWLAADAAARAQADAWRSQNDLINRLYDGEARTPLPVRRTADRLSRAAPRPVADRRRGAAGAHLAGSEDRFRLANDFFSATPEPTDSLTPPAPAWPPDGPRRGSAGLAERDPSRMAAQLSRSLGHPVEIPD